MTDTPKSLIDAYDIKVLRGERDESIRENVALERQLTALQQRLDTAEATINRLRRERADTEIAHLVAVDEKDQTIAHWKERAEAAEAAEVSAIGTPGTILAVENLPTPPGYRVANEPQGK